MYRLSTLFVDVVRFNYLCYGSECAVVYLEYIDVASNGSKLNSVPAISKSALIHIIWNSHLVEHVFDFQKQKCFFLNVRLISPPRRRKAWLTLSSARRRAIFGNPNVRVYLIITIWSADVYIFQVCVSKQTITGCIIIARSSYQILRKSSELEESFYLHVWCL